MKDIDNLVEELEYNKDYNNGCLNEDDLGKSDFTEAGLIDEMEYNKDFDNGCFNEDTGELYEEAVYEKAIYEEAVYEEAVYEEEVGEEEVCNAGELDVCEEEQGYDDSGGHEQAFGGQEHDFGGHAQDFGGQEQDFGGQEQEFGGQEQEFREQEQDCGYIDEYDEEYGNVEYGGDKDTDNGFYN